MGQVKADGRCAAGLGPELAGSERLHQRQHVFPNLLQGVRRGLQQWDDAIDGAAKPDLGGSRHPQNLAAANQLQIADCRLKSKTEPERAQKDADEVVIRGPSYLQ